MYLCMYVPKYMKLNTTSIYGMNARHAYHYVYQYATCK